LEGAGFASLEALATAVLDDINNEVVARWVQVVISAPAPDEPGVDGHSVMLEDRQPKWENDSLLSRLRLV
jgi:7-cyano-7-deazaguanine reductase